MDIVTRLKAYMDHVGLQISQFADLAQIPRPTLSQILSGRNKKISNELLSKLHTAFPLLNISWLLFGDGDMDTLPLNCGGAQNQPAANVSGGQNVNEAERMQDKVQDASPMQSSSPKNVEVDTPRLDFASQSNASEPANAQQASGQVKKETTRPQLSLTPDSTKKIQNIMVFYSDNSFEIFTPTVQQ